jgi:hypothetical protein
MRRLILLAAIAAFDAAAQCVMCQRTAAAQMAERASVINSGILVLGIPPVLILAGILAHAFRRREP